MLQDPTWETSIPCAKLQLIIGLGDCPMRISLIVGHELLSSQFFGVVGQP